MVTEDRACLGKRLTGASGISAKVDTLVGALLCIQHPNPSQSSSAPLHHPQVSGKCPCESSISPSPSHSGRPLLGQGAPVCLSRLAQSPSLTFLPVPVEDFDVFELDADACSQGHRVCGIVFTPTLDGAIGVSPGGREDQAVSKASTEVRREGTDGQGEGQGRRPHLSLQ